MPHILNDILLPRGLFSGYSFRGKVQHYPKGSIHIIQLKDIVNEYSTIGDSCFLTPEGQVPTNYYLQPGDLLLIAKGAHNYSLVYEASDPFPAVATSVFYVLRVDPKKADSHYVSWWINQKKVQRYFQSMAAGTYSQNITRDTVANIPLTLPAIPVQKSIANIARLATKEQALYAAIKEKRIQLTEAMLLKSIDSL